MTSWPRWRAGSSPCLGESACGAKISEAGPSRRSGISAWMSGDHEDKVIVVADLPGVEKENVTVRLIDPRRLEIRSRRAGESTEEAADFFMRERVYGEMSRTVMLPAEVTEEGATASFKNGVLEVQLKKVPVEAGTTIPIE